MSRSDHSQRKWGHLSHRALRALGVGVRTADAFVAFGLFPATRVMYGASRQSLTAPSPLHAGSQDEATTVLFIQFGIAQAIKQHGPNVLEWFVDVGHAFDRVLVLDPLASSELALSLEIPTSAADVGTREVTVIAFKASMFRRTWLWPLENSLAAIDLLAVARSLDGFLGDGPVVIWSLTHDRALWLARTLASRHNGVAVIAEIRGNYELMHELHGSTFFLWTTGQLRSLSELAWQMSRVLIKQSLRGADAVVGRNLNNLKHAKSITGVVPNQRRELIRIEVPESLTQTSVPTSDVNSLVADASRRHVRRPTNKPKCSTDSDDPFTVLFSSRLSVEKFPLDVVEAWALSRSRHLGARLIVIGDGPLATTCQLLANRLNLEETIHFLGSLPNDRVLELTATAHLGLETYGGSSLAEKALLACPVAAYDIEWHSELVDHLRTGLMIPFGDIQGMANAIDWTYAHPTESAAMAHKLQRKAQDMFQSEIRRQSESELARWAIKLAQRRRLGRAHIAPDVRS